jgi:hypothetical protein
MGKSWVAQVHVTAVCGLKMEFAGGQEFDHKKREKQDSTRTPLEYYIHDEADALRFEIVGNLTGPAVGSVDQAWRTAHSVLDGRKVVVGLTAFADANQSGRDLLLSWHRSGARIIARSPESLRLAEDIVGAPVPMPAPKSAWRQRVRDFVLRRSTAAAMKLA